MIVKWDTRLLCWASIQYPNAEYKFMLGAAILLIVIRGNVTLLNVILLKFILLNVILLNVILLNVILAQCYSCWLSFSLNVILADCHSIKYHSSECHSSEYHSYLVSFYWLSSGWVPFSWIWFLLYVILLSSIGPNVTPPC